MNGNASASCPSRLNFTRESQFKSEKQTGARGVRAKAFSFIRALASALAIYGGGKQQQQAAATTSSALPLLNGSSQCAVLQTARGVTRRARVHREGGEQRDSTCVKPNTPTQIAILHRVKNMVRKLLLSVVSRIRSSRSFSADL